MKFSNNLKLLRKRYHFTQERLSFEIGVQNTSISNYESGKSLPELATLLRLREVFHVDLETLIFGDISKIPKGMEYSSEVKMIGVENPENTEGCMMAGGCVLRRVAVMEEKLKDKE